MTKSSFPICLFWISVLPFCVAESDCLAEGRHLAVVVGVDAYRANSGLPSLQHAGSDAKQLSAALRQCGYTVYEMTQEAARQPGMEAFAPYAANVRDQIDGVLSFPNLGPDDSIMITFHGHGAQFEHVDAQGTKSPRFYFCPADASVQGVTSDSQINDRNYLIALQELYDLLKDCKAGTKLLVVDACRNDPSRPSEFRAGLASATLPQLPPPPGGTAAFFSCKANQRAVEDPEFKQGVFTHFLVDGLLGKADQPLANRPADGVITFSELTTYVANNTYAYVYDKYKVKQSPEMRGEFDLNLPLARRLGPVKEFTNSIGMKLVLIPAGTFMMGSPTDEPERYRDETQHQVTLANDYYLGKYEVTQAEFERVMGFNPSHFTDSKRLPVETVSWFDAVQFCNELSELDGRASVYRVSGIEKVGDSIKSATVDVNRGANGYRLPTEAEWEYACRGGTKTPFSFGANITTAQVNYDGNYPYNNAVKGTYRQRTIDVDALTGNAFGLHQMHGNVFEWCWDWSADYPAGSVTNPTGPTEKGSDRVYRGGSWGGDAWYCRSAYRGYVSPGGRGVSLGFRVAVGR